jgi:hypothetical protein
LQEFSVDRVGVTGECCASEGKGGDSRDELGETGEVGVECVGVGEEEVGPSDGLSSLVVEQEDELDE